MGHFKKKKNWLARLRPGTHRLKYRHARRWAKEVEMAESMTGMWLGVIVLIVAAILVAEHYRRERRRGRQLRWLDTHPTHDWLHHRH
jgi:hypothetical protein